MNSIAFSPDLIIPLREGRKTQTRRIAKMKVCGGRRIPLPVDCDLSWADRNAVNPYGKPGDLLWVREQFYYDMLPYSDGGSLAERPEGFMPETLYYRADGDCCEQIPECACAEVGKPRWRPSIHCPRWASRYTIRLVDLGLEKLHDITESDAQCEGVEPDYIGWQGHAPYTAGFADKWHSLHGYGDHPTGWDSNPWVWRIVFELHNERR